MADFNKSLQAPEREHSLPTTFIDKREEFYASKSNITKSRILRDERQVKTEVLEYMVLLDYICNRIKPKLRGKYKEEIGKIQAYILVSLDTLGSTDKIPIEILEQLELCHETVCGAMVSYGFDQITPTVLNI